MAFKPVNDLDCEVTTALGGRNKQTGKPNPTKIEGYFLGSKDTVSKKAKNGIAKLHIFQTQKGNIGVWGKTDLDRKLSHVNPGCMVRVTQNGTVPTLNGDMYKYLVEVDEDNSIEVSVPRTQNTSADATDDDYSAGAAEDASDEVVEEEYVEEEEPVDEPPARRATPPARPAATPDASRRAKVQALLSGKK